MKNHSLIIFSFIAVLAISSCKKDSDNNNTVTDPSAMTATIGSTQWTSITRITTLTNQKFNIAATSAGLEVLDLIIYGDTIGTYTYNILPALTKSSCTFKKPAVTLYYALSGSVKLTDVNKTAKTITGTFSFTLTNLEDTKTISNGVFTSLRYTETN